MNLTLECSDFIGIEYLFDLFVDCCSRKVFNWTSIFLFGGGELSAFDQY